MEPKRRLHRILKNTKHFKGEMMVDLKQLDKSDYKIAIVFLIGFIGTMIWCIVSEDLIAYLFPIISGGLLAIGISCFVFKISNVVKHKQTKTKTFK